jgi:hypothetical protein
MPGVTHSWQEHILPDQITSPIFTLHLGQFNLCSLDSSCGSHAGGLMKKDVQF